MGVHFSCKMIHSRDACIPGRKKKNQKIFRSRRWACIFRLKWCTVGIHNAMARTGLETNSSGDACCLWYRISLSADENMKTNSGNKCISEKWKTYAFFVFQSHICEKELSKSLRLEQIHFGSFNSNFEVMDNVLKFQIREG